jgi:hypothetical protein
MVKITAFTVACQPGTFPVYRMFSFLFDLFLLQLHGLIAARCLDGVLDTYHKRRSLLADQEITCALFPNYPGSI